MKISKSKLIVHRNGVPYLSQIFMVNEQDTVHLETVLKRMDHLATCTTETNDIAVPIREGLESLVFGLAEYAEGEADRTFKTCKMA